MGSALQENAQPLPTVASVSRRDDVGALPVLHDAAKLRYDVGALPVLYDAAKLPAQRLSSLHENSVRKVENA